MSSCEKLAQQYAAQQKPKGRAGNVYYVGRVFYSYGEHFPMAYVRGTRAFFNATKYSVSTSRQQSTVRSVLHRAGYSITECSTDELRDVIAREQRAQREHEQHAQHAQNENAADLFNGGELQW